MYVVKAYGTTRAKEQVHKISLIIHEFLVVIIEWQVKKISVGNLTVNERNRLIILVILPTGPSPVAPDDLIFVENSTVLVYSFYYTEIE